MESLWDFIWFFAEDVVQTEVNYVVIEIFSVLLKHDITKQLIIKLLLHETNVCQMHTMLWIKDFRS